MHRTALKDRTLPDYTKGEEIFNSVSHIVGGGLGLVFLVLSVVVSSLEGNAWSIVGSSVYGVTMTALYSISSIYHGLRPGTGKKVLQILDHCTIYFFISGTYTPLLLCSVRSVSPVCAWILFGVVWGLTALATVFTAIDLKKYAFFSMACYIGMGWCIVLATRVTVEAIGMQGFMWLIAGGIAYTVGAVLYGLGRKRRYMHSLFHIFVLLGSILQFVCIFRYVIQ